MNTSQTSFATYLRRYLPLLISMITALLLVLGMLQVTLWNIVLLVLQVYLLIIFTFPLIKSPSITKQDHLTLSLPLLYLTTLWSCVAIFPSYIEHTSLLSALIFAIVLGLTTPFLQPLMILSAICFETALIIAYPLTDWQIYFHASTHTIAMLVIPRFIHVEWIKRAIYPRTLEVNELPVAQRHFVPALHPVIENAAASNIQPPELDLGSVAADLLVEDALNSKALDQMVAEWVESDDRLIALNPVDLQSPSRTPSEELDLGLSTRQVQPFLPATQITDFKDFSIRYTRQAMQFIKDSFKAQLDVLRQQLLLDTAAVIWRKGHTGKAGLKSVSTDRKEWICKSFPINYGILEEAFERPMAFHEPIEATHLVPYYDRRVTLGGFISVPIFIDGQDQDVASGILCIDRNIDQPWESGDLKLVQSVAKKLALDIQTSRLLKQLSYNTILVERLYLGLKTLNETLDLQAVSDASIKSIQIHGLSHVIIFCLREGEQVRILRAYYDQVTLQLDGVLFHMGMDAISQCIKLGQELNNIDLAYPPHEFLSIELPPDLQLLKTAVVFPLNNPSDPRDIQGCIMVASRSDQLIESPYLDPIRLIVQQIAVKLSLSNAHERLRELALKDGLTGLKNHMTFQSTLTDMLNRAYRLQQPLTLILLDIDHFKSLNDQYGHPFGDIVLKGVAEALSLEMREVDLVARYGGEEFAIVLESSTLEGGLYSADRVRQSVAALLFDYEGIDVRVTISLGVACYPYDAEDKALLIERADKALYLAKRNGRNRVASWQNLASDEKHTSLGWTSHSPAILPPYVQDTSQALAADDMMHYHDDPMMQDTPVWPHDTSEHAVIYPKN